MFNNKQTAVVKMVEKIGTDFSPDVKRCPDCMQCQQTMDCVPLYI